MFFGVVIALTALACLIPHRLDQSRLSPVEGAALWTAVLSLRAVLTIVVALTTLIVLPSTEFFVVLTHWCAHGALPFLPTHLEVDGHRIGGLALLMPLVVLLASAVWAISGVWRAAKAVRRWLGGSTLGEGPRESLIVSGSEPVVAAAGFRPARVVVSAGALIEMDDAELAASLEHEWGHVTRCHRLVLAAAHILHALSRPFAGGREAFRNLQFHLERDADEYAVRRTGDALALASAICKVAVPPTSTRRPVALTGLAHHGVSDRVRLLSSGQRRAKASCSPRLLIAVTTALTLFIAVQAPAVWDHGLEQIRLAETSHVEGC